MRLILLGFLLHWNDQLPVGGVPVFCQMVKKQASAFQLIACYVRLIIERYFFKKKRITWYLLPEIGESVCIGWSD